MIGTASAALGPSACGWISVQVRRFASPQDTTSKVLSNLNTCTLEPKKAIKIKGETRQPAVGNGRVLSRCDKSCSFVLQIEGVQMRLGIWWLESAMRGAVDVLPVVNKEPSFES
mmetsp:Transcript_60804/g.99402  ORF Transcript_60804/g.99402 Transcript_60804/m.99402 type:complete len:114 (-) Transcript_60804:240-581(-)